MGSYDHIKAILHKHTNINDEGKYAWPDTRIVLELWEDGTVHAWDRVYDKTANILEEKERPLTPELFDVLWDFGNVRLEGRSWSYYDFRDTQSNRQFKLQFGNVKRLMGR